MEDPQPNVVASGRIARHGDPDRLRHMVSNHWGPRVACTQGNEGQRGRSHDYDALPINDKGSRRGVGHDSVGARVCDYEGARREVLLRLFIREQLLAVSAIVEDFVGQGAIYMVCRNGKLRRRELEYDLSAFYHAHGAPLGTDWTMPARIGQGLAEQAEALPGADVWIHHCALVYKPLGTENVLDRSVGTVRVLYDRCEGQVLCNGPKPTPAARAASLASPGHNGVDGKLLWNSPHHQHWRCRCQESVLFTNDAEIFTRHSIPEESVQQEQRAWIARRGPIPIRWLAQQNNGIDW